MNNILMLLGLHSGILLLLIVGFIIFTKTSKENHILVLFGLIFATNAMYFVPNLPLFDNLTFYWQPKILISLICIGYILLQHYNSKNEISFSMNVKKEIWIYFASFLIVTVGINSLISGELNFGFDLESFLFSMTVPGISEELLYRGIIMSLLNKVFTGRKQLFGISLGWGALIQILFFGIGHAFYFNDNQHIQFYSVGFFFTTMMGIILTFLKEKSGSIIPSILFHNAYNTIIGLI